jgi:DNA-binding NarL/FixJ family response regulator
VSDEREFDSKDQVNVLIVEDHQLFAEAISITLQAHGMRVIGVASSAGEALSLLTMERVDLVLLDVALPDSDGIVLGQDLIERFPTIKIVVVTALHDAKTLSRSVQAGFHGYMTKDTALPQFVNAIRAVLGGQIVVPYRLATTTVRRSPEQQAADMRTKHLTDREKEVLELLRAGASGNQIAERLSVSPNTVRTHVQNILTKLQVHSRLEAAAFSSRYGVAGEEASRDRK